nr:tyrosine-type recombinase/integrase [Lactococcus petauri]
MNNFLSFKYYGKETGLDKQFSCHCMRHSHISLLAERGINQKVVMQRVGHATSTITNNIYTHVTPNMSKELNQKMNRINKIS